MADRLSILFVDDDSRLLEGLVRMLRPYRQEWEVLTAGSGPEALAVLAKRHIDVLISDMRMPGMSGAELLEQVAESHPDVVRFILSGQADRESLMRSLGSTHQYLAKPCDSLQLRAAVERAYALRHLLKVPRLTSLVSRIGALPSLPGLYLAIRKELQAEEPSIKRIGELAAQDIGMCSKLLQVANSGRFARRGTVVRAEEAVQLLGLETIQSLALASHLFKTCPVNRLPLTDLWQHSLAVAHGAKAIAMKAHQGESVCDCAFSAGLLHDCGILLLASHLPEQFERIQTAAAHMPWLEAERQELDATHQDLGAYLLGLWGLPDALVEAVAHHHRPSAVQHPGFTPLAAVYISEAAVRAADGPQFWESGSTEDAEFSAEEGILPHLAEWRAVADTSASCHGEMP